MAHSEDASLGSRFYLRLVLGKLLEDSPVVPKNRSRASIRKATFFWAEKWLAVRAELIGKDRTKLLSSFRTRFDESDAVEQLRKDPRLTKEAIGSVMAVIVGGFDDLNITSSAPPFELKLSPEESRKGARILRRAAQFLRSTGDIQFADAVSSAADRYGAPKRLGRPPSPVGDLEVELDLVLGAIPTPERTRISSALVSDFCTQRETDQVRHLLKDRYRRWGREK